MFMPWASSRAARVTIRVRASSVEGSATSVLPHGAPLDPLLVAGPLEDPLNEDARRVNVVGIELTHLDELLDLGDRDLPRHRRERVEVARGIAIDEIADRVAPPRLDEREVSPERPLEQVGAPVELPGLLAVGD